MKEFVWSFVLGFTIVIALGMTALLIFMRDPGEARPGPTSTVLP